jgi:hypothetical protein
VRQEPSLPRSGRQGGDLPKLRLEPSLESGLGEEVAGIRGVHHDERQVAESHFVRLPSHCWDRAAVAANRSIAELPTCGPDATMPAIRP